MQNNTKKPYLKIYGGYPLKGETYVSGAKNAILPLMFASLLADGRHEFENVPHLKDVDSALKMLSSLGLSWHREKSRLLIDNFHLKACLPCEKSARSFRAGILCLGPLLARLGKAQIPLPGGCEIGSRPIDIHLQGLKNMGADVFVEKGSVFASAPKGGLKACKMQLPFPSVGATENLIMACVLTKGESCLKNPAREPEVEDLIHYLNRFGRAHQPSARTDKNSRCPLFKNHCKALLHHS